MEVRVESGEEDAAVSVPSGLGGDMPWWRGEAVDVVDIAGRRDISTDSLIM